MTMIDDDDDDGDGGFIIIIFVVVLALMFFTCFECNGKLKIRRLVTLKIRLSYIGDNKKDALSAWTLQQELCKWFVDKRCMLCWHCSVFVAGMMFHVVARC